MRRRLTTLDAKSKGDDGLNEDYSDDDLEQSQDATSDMSGYGRGRRAKTPITYPMGWGECLNRAYI
jgi:hypothetical protein